MVRLLLFLLLKTQGKRKPTPVTFGPVRSGSPGRTDCSWCISARVSAKRWVSPARNCPDSRIDATSGSRITICSRRVAVHHRRGFSQGLIVEIDEARPPGDRVLACRARSSGSCPAEALDVLLSGLERDWRPRRDPATRLDLPSNSVTVSAVRRQVDVEARADRDHAPAGGGHGEGPRPIGHDREKGATALQFDGPAVGAETADSGAVCVKRHAAAIGEPQLLHLAARRGVLDRRTRRGRGIQVREEYQRRADDHEQQRRSRGGRPPSRQLLRDDGASACARIAAQDLVALGIRKALPGAIGAVEHAPVNFVPRQPFREQLLFAGGQAFRPPRDEAARPPLAARAR